MKVTSPFSMEQLTVVEGAGGNPLEVAGTLVDNMKEAVGIGLEGS